MRRSGLTNSLFWAFLCGVSVPTSTTSPAANPSAISVLAAQGSGAPGIMRLLACRWHYSHSPGCNPSQWLTLRFGKLPAGMGGWPIRSVCVFQRGQVTMWWCLWGGWYCVVSSRGCVGCGKTQRSLTLSCHKARGMCGFSFRLSFLHRGSNSDQQDTRWGCNKTTSSLLFSSLVFAFSLALSVVVLTLQCSTVTRWALPALSLLFLCLTDTSTECLAYLVD